MSRARGVPHTPDEYRKLISSFITDLRPRQRPLPQTTSHTYDTKRQFHDYFVTHLPSSSLHPDSRSSTGLAHKFSRKDSTPHTPDGKSSPASHPSVGRDTTVVRIPLKSAKHHYGVSVSRGSRPYNEDSHQAGVIELPAFAKKPPSSVSLGKRSDESVGGDSASGDPQVFYFGVFDGHGGAECSDFLRERLHTYLEKTATDFEFRSSLQSGEGSQKSPQPGDLEETDALKKQGREALDAIHVLKDNKADGKSGTEEQTPSGEAPVMQHGNQETVHALEKTLVKSWRELVGGYFRRFKPTYFSIYQQASNENDEDSKVTDGVAIEEVITYAFLKADYDFVAAQAAKEGEHSDSVKAERPLNDDEMLGRPSQMAEHIGGRNRFKGGSTCSIAMVSTPKPTPFWNPATSSTMLIAHVGDTRVIVCSTSTGHAVPLTTNHHPSSPIEANRLRRYAATFVTDSFGEERISGLANTRAFGDIASKRIGVSAEPEIKRIELGAAEYSFMVLISDGVSGTLNDQEIVDIVKEAKTPDQAARDVINFATEVSAEGDNATCLVVRLGGWERRQEGGHGSLSTKESREYKREAAADPRSSRQ